MAFAARIAVPSLLATGIASAASPNATESATVAADAAQLFEKGKTLFKNGKLQDAHDAFRRAWELRQSPEIAANLAATELELGRFRDAAEHLAFALRSPAPGTTAATLRALQTALQEAQTKIGTLRVTAEPRTAELNLDGVRVARSAATSELYLDAGEHTLTAEAPGYESAALTLRVDAGQLLEQRIELRRLEPSAIDPWTASARRGSAVAPAAPSPRVEPAREPHRASWENKATALTIGGSVVFAATGAGLSFLRARGLAQDDAERLAVACDGPCDDAARTRNEASRHGTVTVVAFATAGAGALGTALYLALAAPEHQTTSMRRSYVPVWIASGITAIGVASGVVFLTQASSADDQRATVLRELQERSGDNPCAERTPYVRACASVWSSAREHTLSRDLATTSFTTAGASLLGTATYLLFTSSSDSRMGERQALWIEPHPHGAAMHGSF